MKEIRPDITRIISMVRPNATVLDLGCGDGKLLAGLAAEKGTRGQGVEIDPDLITLCVRAGVNVVYGDLDRGLADYPDQSFDYVILNNSIPEVENPRTVIREALRVGRRTIIGFANYCHYSARWQMGVLGRVPVTPNLPHKWYDTPNRHFLGIRDFNEFCRERKIRVIEKYFLSRGRPVLFFPNLRADYAIFTVHA